MLATLSFFISANFSCICFSPSSIATTTSPPSFAPSNWLFFDVAHGATSSHGPSLRHHPSNLSFPIASHATDLSHFHYVNDDRHGSMFLEYNYCTIDQLNENALNRVSCTLNSASMYTVMRPCSAFSRSETSAADLWRRDWCLKCCPRGDDP